MSAKKILVRNEDASTSLVNSAAGTGTATGTTAAGSAHSHGVTDPGHDHGGVTGGPNLTPSIRRLATLPALSAAGAALVAPIAGGAPVNEIGPFTLPMPRRTVQITLGVGGVPTVYTIVGTGTDGAPHTMTVTAGGAGTFIPTGAQGNVALQSIASVTSDVDPVGQTTIETGDGFFAGSFVILNALSVDETVEVPASIDAGTGTVVPTTAPNAAHNYFLDITEIVPDAAHTHAVAAGVTGISTATESAHTHAAGTLAGPSHTHTITSP